MKAKLVDFYELAPGVRHFEFSIPELEQIEFTPGQFISVNEETNGKQITRAYSICSASPGNHFELCLNRVDEGLISPLLFDLKPGNEIEVSGPLGYFTLRNPDRDLLLIATGTGIAPFRSMLHAHLPEATTQFTLLFGARHEAGVLYKAELEALAQRQPNFRFWPTLTKPTLTWNGLTGRVQTHLDEALGGRTDLDVYLCGMKEMVDDIRARLKQRGFDRKQIIYEKYD